MLVCFFAASFLDQYLTKRDSHYLLWGLAFVLIAMAMGLWFLRETFGLSEWIFRLWYISGAMLVPALLGTGMLYLLAPQRVAHAFTGFLLVAIVAVVVLVLTASIRTPEACTEGLTKLNCLEPSDTMTTFGFMPDSIRVLGAVLNLYGGLIILGTALWGIASIVRTDSGRSGWSMSLAGQDAIHLRIGRMIKEVSIGMSRDVIVEARVMWQNKDFWRRDVTEQRVASGLIMTLGLALGGVGLTLNSVEGSSVHLGFFLASVLVIYGGFLASREVFEKSPHNQLTESIQTTRTSGIGNIEMPENLRSRLHLPKRKGGGS